MRKIILAAVLLTAFNAANAAFVSGTVFMQANEEQAKSYAVGVADMIDAWDDKSVCIPVGVSTYELMAVGKKYYADHPEKMHFIAASSLIIAFRQAFPCK